MHVKRYCNMCNMYILLCFGMMGGGGGGRRATTRGPGGGIGPGTGGGPLWPPEPPEPPEPEPPKPPEPPEEKPEEERPEEERPEEERPEEERPEEERPSGQEPSISLPKPYFTISASPRSRTVSPGRSARYTITVTSHNGFSQPVSLSTGRLPVGCKPSFSPNAVTPPRNRSRSSELTVTTSSATPATQIDTYDLSVNGTWKTLVETTIVKLKVK